MRTLEAGAAPIAGPSVARATILAAVRETLTRHAQVDAAWEGGSAAFDALDEYSDIDAVAVVADQAQAEVFASVERAITVLSPLLHRHEVADTRGYAQKFFQLRDAHECHVVDLVLIRRGDPLIMREVELHGVAKLWLDRRSILREEHLDALADAEQARARIAPLRAAFGVFQHIPRKERLRGRAVEALYFYHAFTIRPLTEALRLLYCPQKRIFSIRYLARDLPGAVVSELTTLTFVADLADLEAKHARAEALFERVIGLLEREGPGALRAVHELP